MPPLVSSKGCSLGHHHQLAISKSKIINYICIMFSGLKSALIAHFPYNTMRGILFLSPFFRCRMWRPQGQKLKVTVLESDRVETMFSTLKSVLGLIVQRVNDKRQPPGSMNYSQNGATTEFFRCTIDFISVFFCFFLLLGRRRGITLHINFKLHSNFRKLK